MKTSHTPIPIPQIAGYGATPDGNIWSLSSNWRGYGIRSLAPTPNGKGYMKVRIMMGGHRRNITVHRLIASTFLPIRPGQDFEIRHKNGNRLDNRASNLCWGTRKDNADDRKLHGRTSRGRKHSEFIKAGLAAIAKAEGGK